MSFHQQLVRLGMELGLSISDYNMGVKEDINEVVKVTLAYLDLVNRGVQEGKLDKEDEKEYYAMVGQSWVSIQAKFDNEYLVN